MVRPVGPADGVFSCEIEQYLDMQVDVGGGKLVASLCGVWTIQDATEMPAYWPTANSLSVPTFSM